MPTAIILTLAKDIYAFVLAHQLFSYYVLAVAIGNLPAPDATSGKFYRWFYGFVQAIGANIPLRKTVVPVKP